MSKLGIHFPNAGFRDLDVLWSIAWKSFVILHLNREWVPEIRLRFPKATILVRAFLKNWTITDPVKWAREICQWANELRRFNIAITFANEQNLSAEGHPLGARPGTRYPPASVYRDILQWNTAVIRGLRAEIPWAAIHFPALSPGHSDDQRDAGYVGFEILREAVQMCDVLDAHIYWDEHESGQRRGLHYGERYRLLHSLFPDKPIFISETASKWSDAAAAGRGLAEWLAALPDYVTGASWFIWDSDARNRQWILRDRPPMVESMRSIQLAEPAPSEPHSMLNPIDIAMVLVMGWTGFSATAYAASNGDQAIGYGHLIQQSDGIGPSVSETEAKALLHNDLERCLRTLEAVAKTPLTTNQKAALISFVHDIGIAELQGSVVLKNVNSADYVGASAALRNWYWRDGRNSPGSARRRQIESELFLRDVITPNSATAVSATASAPTAPLLCAISATATWVSVMQGQHYQIIGVWYDRDASRTIPSVKDGADEVKNGGRLVVKVEDQRGLGIPAELVVHRWDNAQGECEPQLSDTSGVARFELAADSRFDPRRARGPDCIQVGDCLVEGLGIPSHGTGGGGLAVHMIRIRKVVK